MSSFFSRQDITLSPLVDDIAGSNWQSLRRDLIAGFAVALLTLPQAMAYALMAGLPIACGLFAAVLATCISSLFGSSRHLVVGPTNTIAILVQAGTAELLYTHYRDVSGPMREMLSLQIVTELTVLVGLFQMFAAFSGMGRLTQFVSHSVVVGYMTGTAIALGVNQLFLFCGFDAPAGMVSVYQKVFYLLTNLHRTELVSLGVALACLPFLFYQKYSSTRLPAAGITLTVSALFFFVLRSYPEWFGNSPLQDVQLVGDAGLIGPIVPQWVSVPFDMTWINTLFPIALAIALLGMLEVSVIGKGIAAKSGQHLSVNQEIFGLGLGNLISGFVGAMPSSGSSSRSFLNYSSGAKTRLAGASSGIFIFLILFGFSDLLQFVPMGAFAAMLFVTALGLVDGKQFLLCLRANGPDAFVLFVTILSCMIFSVDVAFFIGIGLSITFYLNKAATPYLVENRMNDSGDMQPSSAHSGANKEIRMISVHGELFFGAADLLHTTLKTLAAEDQKIRVLIIRLKHARDVDATACLALLQLHRYLIDSSRFLVICSITPPVWDVLCNSGVADEIGRNNLFLQNAEDSQQAVKLAWRRARSLVSPQSVTPPVKPVVEEIKIVVEQTSPQEAALATLLSNAEGASVKQLDQAVKERAELENSLNSSPAFPPADLQIPATIKEELATSHDA